MKSDQVGHILEPASPFTEREKEVITCLMQASSNKQIAHALGITTRTVEFHLGNIYAKLDVNSRAEAILKLSESDLLEPTGEAVISEPWESTVASQEDSENTSYRTKPGFYAVCKPNQETGFCPAIRQTAR